MSGFTVAEAAWGGLRDGQGLAMLLLAFGTFVLPVVLHERLRAQEPPTNMLVAMSIAAALCLAVGIYPQALYRLLPFEMAYSPYDVTHILTQLQLLFFSALAFVWLNLRRLYPPELPSVNLDVEWLYRRLLPTAARSFVAGVFRLDERLRKGALRMIDRLLTAMTSHYKPAGVMARSWLTGSMVAGVVLVLGVYLLLGLSR